MPVNNEHVKETVRKRGLEFDGARSLSNGHHAKTVIEFSGNGDGKLSHIIKWISFSEAGEEDGAMMLMSTIYSYRKQLEYHRVPIVKIHYLFKDQHNENQYLVEIAEHGGPTIEKEITDGDPAKALATIRATLATVDRLFQSAKGHILDTGLNFVPRNFTRDASGRIRYIDYFLPYAFPFLTWPPSADRISQDLEQWRHYDVKGLLQVFLVQICRLRPELRDQTENLIATRIDQWQLRMETWWCHERPAKRLEQVLTSRGKVSSRGLRKLTRKALRIIKRLRLQNLYDLRDCAVLMAAQGILDQVVLEEIFAKTHFDIHRPLDELAFTECRSKLASLL